MKNGIKNPWAKKIDYSELPGERPTYFKVPLGKSLNGTSNFTWGNRFSRGNSGGNSNRRMF